MAFGVASVSTGIGCVWSALFFCLLVAELDGVALWPGERLSLFALLTFSAIAWRGMAMQANIVNILFIMAGVFQGFTSRHMQDAFLHYFKINFLN